MKKILFSIVLLVFCTQLWADTLFVRPGDYSKIQDAINDADDGDKIIVDPCTYYENINFLGKAITLTSTDPNDPNVITATIIDGSLHTDPNIGSVVTFNSGETSDSVLTGFTITGGTGSWLTTSWEFKGKRWNRCGGGVLCYNMSEPVVTKNIFRDNIADQGAGIYVYGDPVNPDAPSNPPIHLIPEISFNTFLDNDANINWGYIPPNNDYPFEEHGDGGAIVCFQGVDALIIGNNIHNNRADAYGGGMHIRQWSYGSILDNTITNNRSGTGAGIHITYRSAPLVKNNFLKNNHSGGGGGAIYVYLNSHPIIEQNNITENSSIYCSGICSYWNSQPIVQNNTLYRNNGCAIYYSTGANGPVINNTVSNNTTAFYSAAVYNDGTGTILLENNIITSNSLGYGIRSENPGKILARYNNVWDNELGNYNDIVGDQNQINGNISADPGFIDDSNDIYYLKSQGFRWDTSLQTWNTDTVTSRCIDAGNPGYQLGSELLTVPSDPCGLLAENSRINLGAYGNTQYASLPPYYWALLSDIDNSGSSDLVDFALLSQIWLNQNINQYADFNRDGKVDEYDLALMALDWLKETSWH